MTIENGTYSSSSENWNGYILQDAASNKTKLTKGEDHFLGGYGLKFFNLKKSVAELLNGVFTNRFGYFKVDHFKAILKWIT